MKVSIWGTEGRINADRQEVQIYYRGDNAEQLKLTRGWNVRYTTELTEDVWFYLRGEEYSAQMDHFFQQIKILVVYLHNFPLPILTLMEY